VRTLDLNLASRPFRNNTLLWVGHSVLMGSVVAATAWNTVTFLETGGKLEDLRSSVGSIENRLDRVEVLERRLEADIARHDLKYLATQTARANDVIARKALSWTRLFNLLEKVQPYEVKMVSVRPVFGRGSPTSGAPLVVRDRPGEDIVPVSVEGTARDLNAFLDLERALIADPHFDRVEPERRTHARDGEVLFLLSFLYDPAGTLEPEPSAGSASAREGPPAASGDAQEAVVPEDPAQGEAGEGEEP